MTSRPASEFGKRRSRTRSAASRCRQPRLPGTASSSSAMRAETSRVARGACMRSTRRPARSSGSSFWFPRAEGDMIRGPQGATPLDMSTWKNAPGIPDQRRRDLDLIHARSENRAAVRPRRQSGSRLRDRRARGREPLLRLGRRARRQDRRLQAPFQDCAERLARLGCLQPARPDSNDGRQAAHGRSRPRMATSMASISPTTARSTACR